MTIKLTLEICILEGEHTPLVRTLDVNYRFDKEYEIVYNQLYFIQFKTLLVLNFD